MDTEEAWQQFKKGSAIEKSVDDSQNLVGMLKTILAQQNEIKTDTERIRQLVPKILGDEGAINAVNEEAGMQQMMMSQMGGGMPPMGGSPEEGGMPPEAGAEGAPMGAPAEGQGDENMPEEDIEDILGGTEETPESLDMEAGASEGAPEEIPEGGEGAEEVVPEEVPTEVPEGAEEGEALADEALGGAEEVPVEEIVGGGDPMAEIMGVIDQKLGEALANGDTATARDIIDAKAAVEAFVKSASCESVEKAEEGAATESTSESGASEADITPNGGPVTMSADVGQSTESADPIGKSAEATPAPTEMEIKKSEEPVAETESTKVEKSEPKVAKVSPVIKAEKKFTAFKDLMEYHKTTEHASAAQHAYDFKKSIENPEEEGVELTSEENVETPVESVESVEQTGIQPAVEPEVPTEASPVTEAVSGDGKSVIGSKEGLMALLNYLQAKFPQGLDGVSEEEVIGALTSYKPEPQPAVQETTVSETPVTETVETETEGAPANAPETQISQKSASSHPNTSTETAGCPCDGLNGPDRIEKDSVASASEIHLTPDKSEGTSHSVEGFMPVSGTQDPNAVASAKPTTGPLKTGLNVMKSEGKHIESMRELMDRMVKKSYSSRPDSNCSTNGDLSRPTLGVTKKSVGSGEPVKITDLEGFKKSVEASWDEYKAYRAQREF